MKTLSEINELSRQDLEAFLQELNSSNSNRLDIPFYVLAALRTTGPETGLPLSNAMFYIMLCRMLVSESVFSTLVCDSTDWWLNDPNIKYWCAFIDVGNIRRVLLLTGEQGSLLQELRNLPRGSWSGFMILVAEKANNKLPVQELTEAEKANPVVVEGIIPPNSGSLAVAEHTSRFSGAIWFEEIRKKTIILAGLGGIGSYVCFLLSRMQPTSMFLYDDDIVEAANMSGQLYGNSDIDRYKVDAMSDMVARYASFNDVFAIRERFTDASEPADIMICGFDNMRARSIFFNRWLHQVNCRTFRSRCLFIDGRLSAEYFQVYCFTGDDSNAINKYRNTALFSDEEADETVCSYKQTTYMANMIGSVMVNLFTNFVANEVAGAPIRELPYLTTYDGNSMKFTIE